MKKLISLVSVALLTSFTFIGPSMARDFVPVGTDPAVEEKLAVMVKDRREGATWISVIQKESRNEALTGNQWCRSINTESCADKSGIINGTSLLDVCKEGENDCIESLHVYPKDQEPEAAVHQPGVSKGHNYPGDAKLGIPAGSQPSLWKSSSTPNGDGSPLYVVAVSESWWTFNGSVAGISNFSAAVYPVVELAGSSYKPAEIQERLIDGVAWFNHDNGEQGTNDGCVLTDTGKCWARTEFASDVRVKLSLRLNSRVSGWLHGRLAEANVSITPINPMTTRVEIDAAPVDIPILYAEIQKASLTTEESVLVTKWEEIGGFNNGKKWYIFDSDKPYANQILKAFKEESADKAAASQTTWMVTSLNNGQRQSPCLAAQGKLVGLVTTNALTYAGSTPEWKDYSLNYQVGGLHYDKTGEVALGNYEMIIDSNAARCLYGFTKAPVSATVTVVGTGDQNVATTIVSEKDGWLKLAAYGFTFSEKEIQVKLTQPYSKTITKFTGTSKSLSAKQKAEIKATVNKAKSNPKFICTGTYVSPSNKASALARAKAACNYAKSLDKGHSYFAQARQTSAKSFDGKVMLVSK